MDFLRGVDKMYYKYGAILAVCSILLLCSYLSYEEYRAQQTIEEGENNLVRTSSGQREIAFDTLEEEIIITSDSMTVSDEDYDVLLRIVEAEAGGEDYTGKLLVANVVLNRVKSDRFPDTIKDVVYQKLHGKAQFSPVGSGRIDTVIVSDETIEAVDAALAGEDVSEGALYFAARKYADSGKMEWFDTNLNYLFAYGGHEFFTEYE